MTRITVDGEPITIQNARHGVETILTAAGLDWRKYDLIEITGELDRYTVTHRAGETLTIRDGDEFVSAAVSTTTA